MTTYTAIPNGDVDPDSPVTTGLVTLLRDNPISMIEGDATAPAFGADTVDTTQIVAAAVGTGEIANSTTTSAGSVGTDTTVSIALNDWAIFPMVHIVAHNEGLNMSGHTTDGTSASSPRFGLTNNGEASKTYDVDHRWIIAA